MTKKRTPRSIKMPNEADKAIFNINILLSSTIFQLTKRAKKLTIKFLVTVKSNIKWLGLI